jgi:hypothetical protein
VHLPQRQVPDEGIQLPQERGVVSDAFLVLDSTASKPSDVSTNKALDLKIAGPLF